MEGGGPKSIKKPLSLLNCDFIKAFDYNNLSKNKPIIYLFLSYFRNGCLKNELNQYISKKLFKSIYF